MFLKEALLLLAGLAAGSTVAAGVYAFLVVIGVYPRLIGKTATASKGKIFLYETIIALGGLLSCGFIYRESETADREFPENSVASGNAGGRVVAEGSRRRWQNGSWCWISGDAWKCLRTAASSGCGTFLWYFCRLPRHVAGRDIESPAGAEPPPASGSGAAISPSRDCGGEMCGFAVLFLTWNWKTVEERRNHGSQKRSI